MKNIRKAASAVLLAALCIAGSCKNEPAQTTTAPADTAAAPGTAASADTEPSAGTTAAPVTTTSAVTESTPTIETAPLPAASLNEWGLTDNIEAGTILHAWCWSFDTIRESMADIAAAGYSAVQTSPANEVVVGGSGGMQLMGKGKWYYQYQPTDWKIGNYQLGTEDDFKAMCAEADKYGIKIIVDVVPNHTAGDISAVSQSLIDAAGGLEKLLHPDWQKNIVNYASRLDCTSRSLSGLPDVDTENPGFQDYFIEYLNTLIADGADGFRYDTAKHIALPDDPQANPDEPNNFWNRVINEITDADRIFNYGEVLQGDNERLSDYIAAIGHTTASRYGDQLRGLLLGEMLNAKLLSDFQTGSSSVVTWVESHDNYTDGSSARITDSMITRGWAIIAADGAGTPLFFDRPLGATMSDRWGSMNRIGAAGSPLYKSSTVSAVERFRSAMAATSEPTAMVNSSDNTALLISRGARGLVIVNAKEKDTQISEPTALPDGVYPDRGGVSGDFTVSGGVITGTLKAGSAAVLYNDGFIEYAAMPEVWLETEDFRLSEEPTEVKLHVSGAESGVYTISGEETSETSYTDGTVLNLTAGEAETIRLSAKAEDGRETVMTYWFSVKYPVPEGAEISFEKPESWADTVYAYVYDESGISVVKNKTWPGVEMTFDEENGVYTYVTDREWESALIIFSDGKNQYPAAMEPGLDLAEGMTYSVP